MNNGKYGEEITKEICKYISAGSNARDSALLSGICEDTFYEWKKKHAEFSESIKKAELKNKAYHIANITKAGKDTWQASAWALERKWANEYGKRVAMTGGDGGAIKTENTTAIKITPNAILQAAQALKEAGVVIEEDNVDV